MKSPIKYYGGKSYMTNIIIDQFPKDYEIYVEGFGGGASVLFQKPQNGIEIYNDLEENVYSLFKVLSDKDMFIRLKERLDISFYSAQLREEYKELLKTDISLEDRAYYFFYVNRSSFNGVGGFSTACLVRRNMSQSVSSFMGMIDKLPEVHNRLSSVVIEHRDILDLINRYDLPNAFMYLDPPYVMSTRTSGQKYECDMTDEQHEALIERLLSCKCKWLVSGYDNPIYDKLTENSIRLEFWPPHSKVEKPEILWKNY